MTLVADEYEHVVGVDTHAKTHTYAILDARTGTVIDVGTFPTTPAGMERAVNWMRRRGQDELLAAVEGTGSYGATLTRKLVTAGIDVREVKPPRRDERRGRGKSDEYDAVAAARRRSQLRLQESAHPRAGGIRSALRVLLVARQSLDSRRTADKNTLLAMIRSFDLAIDGRKALTVTQTRQISQWRERPTDDGATATIRAEARRLALSVLTTMDQLKANHSALTKHVEGLARTAANPRSWTSHRGDHRDCLLSSWKDPSEAAFANLAGVAPLQASSGNTVRHRLSRRGDRQLNRAIDVIARTRMTCDPETRAYIDRKTRQGRTSRKSGEALALYRTATLPPTRNCLA